MNTAFNHLIARERTADFHRLAEQARLAEEYRAIADGPSPAGSSARVYARLRLWLGRRRTGAAVEG